MPTFCGGSCSHRSTQAQWSASSAVTIAAEAIAFVSASTFIRKWSTSRCSSKRQSGYSIFRSCCVANTLLSGIGFLGIAGLAAAMPSITDSQRFTGDIHTHHGEK